MKRVLASIILVIFTLVLPLNADSLSTGGPYVIGDQITVGGNTNFNTDNKVLVEVYPASFGPTKKYDPTMSGGNSTVVPVVKGENGTYSWSATMNSTGWTPDQYMVRAEVIGKDFIETSIITVSDKTKSDPVPHNSTVNTSALLNPDKNSNLKIDTNSSEKNLTHS